MQLLPGQYTPQVQEVMTRLGSKMPFEQAVEEVRLNHHIEVEESTLRGTTHRHGQTAEALARLEVEQMEREGVASTAQPKKLLVSTDGAFIHLTSGEWREVKTMVVGEFDSSWNEQKSEIEVKTRDISYFSRSYRIREFERYALAELQRRGLDNAVEVVTVNDGSDWTQSFAGYHFPQAVPILDFRHALDYVANAGQAIFAEGTPPFKQWFARMAHQFKHEPPQRTLNDICLLAAKAQTDEQLAIIDNARRYLQKREKLIDYAYFRARGLPIGSGSVESSHKVVVHSRMKQAGMRWAEAHVDPMLTLRNLVCNGRWSEGWQQIIDFHWQQHHQELIALAQRQRPSFVPIFSEAPRVAAVLQKEEKEKKTLPTSKEHKVPYRPAPDHPWRLDIWPTKESWRWN